MSNNNNSFNNESEEIDKEYIQSLFSSIELGKAFNLLIFNLKSRIEKII